MKQKDIITAYQAIMSFSANEKNKKNASLKLNYGLFKIRKMLEPHYEFQGEQEKKIFQELNPVRTDDGNLDFGTSEKRDTFIQKMQELTDMEVDLGEFVKPVVSLNEDVTFTLDEIQALEEFIDFKEE